MIFHSILETHSGTADLSTTEITVASDIKTWIEFRNWEKSTNEITVFRFAANKSKRQNRLMPQSTFWCFVTVSDSIRLLLFFCVAAKIKMRIPFWAKAKFVFASFLFYCWCCFWLPIFYEFSFSEKLDFTERLARARHILALSFSLGAVTAVPLLHITICAVVIFDDDFLCCCCCCSCCCCCLAQPLLLLLRLVIIVISDSVFHRHFAWILYGCCCCCCCFCSLHCCKWKKTISWVEK